jgi:hypothetical protein
VTYLQGSGVEMYFESYHVLGAVGSEERKEQWAQVVAVGAELLGLAARRKEARGARSG